MKWSKINESKTKTINEIKEEIEYFFLDIIDEPNSVTSTSVSIGNTYVKKDEKFNKKINPASVGDYNSFVFELHSDTRVELEDFKIYLNRLSRNFKIIKSSFETKTIYKNGEERNKTEINIEFIFGGPIGLNPKIANMIEFLQSYGYKIIGEPNLTKYYLNKRKKISINLEGNQLSDKDIDKIIVDELNPFEKEFGVKFEDFKANTGSDDNPIRSTRKILRFEKYTIFFYIRISKFNNKYYIDEMIIKFTK